MGTLHEIFEQASKHMHRKVLEWVDKMFMPIVVKHFGVNRKSRLAYVHNKPYRGLHYYARHRRRLENRWASVGIILPI